MFYHALASISNNYQYIVSMEKKYVQILLPKPFEVPFQYEVPENVTVELGDVVEVPFGRKYSFGVVWSFEAQNIDPAKVKKMVRRVDTPAFTSAFRKFIAWVSNYNVAPLGSVLNMAISVNAALELIKLKTGYVLGDVDVKQLTAKRKLVVEVLRGVNQPLTVQDIAMRASVSDAVVRAMIGKDMLQEQEIDFVEGFVPEFSVQDNTAFVLSDEQKEAADVLISKVTDAKNSTTLLDGVTGSGKTEVYFEAIAQALTDGKQVLILLPEITLTTQLMARFYDRFGFMPTNWHSGLTPAQRREGWREIARGEARLIVGARSALMLPYPELGLIVVDEEHEAAFKQEDGVVYHGRDMAVARGFMENIPVILASASPSLETVFNVQNGKYDCLQLPNRFGVATLPDTSVVDMRLEKLGARHWLSARMKEELTLNLDNKHQSLLYLNRRGYAPLTLCRTCGHRFQCPTCTAWLVLHKPPYGHGYLQCHHCGHRESAPKTCPKCDSDTLAPCGPGVERLQEEVAEAFPHARIAMMTSDTIGNLERAQKTVSAIENGEVDIIIGTQMIAKGYNFPKLTFVGVVDADLGLEGGDLRAAERTYQLLHQVAGRAGRYELKGRALFQTYMPDSIVMQALLEHDRDQFNEKELQRRAYSSVPPYSRMAALIISGKTEKEVYALAKQLAACAPMDRGANPKIRVLGPAPAPMLLLRNNYRYRMLIMAKREVNIQAAIRDWISHVKVPSGMKVKVDVDPYSFM
jgi:primosomal protein N' (replication factor Y)